MSRKDFTIVRYDKLSRPGNPRWIVVAKDTGEVLDDAQGYGPGGRLNAKMVQEVLKQRQIQTEYLPLEILRAYRNY